MENGERIDEIIYPILKDVWGYSDFRPMQREIIHQIMLNRDLLAILPTGGGKSICFQVPALAKRGICIVVSPLIALIKDQVQNLKKLNIKALSVHSGMSYREVDIALDNAIYGNYKFLYLSPERLNTQLFRARVSRMDVSMIVVDEAHCISQWGYDFRPDYLTISQIKSEVARNRRDVDSEFIPHDVPIIALTATATEKVADDICDRLSFASKNIIRSGFDRPNLSYLVKQTENKLGNLLALCNKINGSAIIYAGQRKKCEEFASFLQSQGVDAQPYHAGMSKEEREAKQSAWKSNKLRIIVSTNAFGMGIDKPDVRFVCHTSLPDSIESYFQEAGRAGRDGKAAISLVLFSKSDIARLRQIHSNSFPKLEYIADVYQKVFQYLEIPYEYGEGYNIKFSLEDCAKSMKLNLSMLYYSMKYIESLGYWTLSDEITIPTRLFFNVSRDSLYNYNFSEEIEDFMVSLMRLYPGIFSDYIAIDEGYIARSGRFTKDQIDSMIRFLSREHIIKYIPKITSPMLFLNSERLVPENLNLKSDIYQMRKEMACQRLEAIIKYATMTEGDRKRYLLDYFGVNF